MAVNHQRGIIWVGLACAGSLAVLALLLATPGPLPVVSAASDAGTDELDHNRELFARWRNEPEHYARLRRDLRWFLALPPERQERLRKFDHELHDEDSATQAHLEHVLQRYLDWLERLAPADRQRVEAAADAKERLQVVRELREREWIAQLPKATRDKVLQTAAEQRPALVAELRREERRRRQEWEVALKNWDELIQPKGSLPARLEEFPPGVREFVDKALRPVLTEEEKNRLDLAEGQWPLFPRTLVELADKHAVLLPGPTTGPRHFRELPEEARKALSAVKNFPPPAVQKLEGRWPQYAMAVANFAQRRKVSIPPLGWCRLEQFDPPVRQFVTRQLLPALNEQEKEDLAKAEGKWPDYPRELRDLARKHDLTVPGTGLPGPRAAWDKFRATPTLSHDGLPEVPDHVLLNFALHELTAQERDLLNLSFANPLSKERLKQAWIQRHPKEWEGLLTSDLKKRQKKARIPE